MPHSLERSDKIKGRLFLFAIFVFAMIAFLTSTVYISQPCEGMFRQDKYVWDKATNSCVRLWKGDRV